MPRLTRPSRRQLKLVEAKPAPLADFSDPESLRVLAAATRAVARELGREAAREYFAELTGKPKVS